MRIKFEYKRETNRIMKKQSETVNFIYKDCINLFEEKRINSENLNENIKSTKNFYELKSITSDDPINVGMEILFFDIALRDIPNDISKKDIPLLFTTDIFDTKNVREHKVKIDFDVYNQDLNFIYDNVIEIVKEIVKEEAGIRNYDGVSIEEYYINGNIKNKSNLEARQDIVNEIKKMNDLIYG